MLKKPLVRPDNVFLFPKLPWKVLKMSHQQTGEFFFSVKREIDARFPY